MGWAAEFRRPIPDRTRMRKVMHALRLLADERGATSIEYAFIVLMVGIAVIAALTALGTSVAGLFEVPANALAVGV